MRSSCCLSLILLPGRPSTRCNVRIIQIGQDSATQVLGAIVKFEINHKQQVQLGGVPQMIHVWSTDLDNPVILFIHGGPGVPNRHLIRFKMLDLASDYTLVAWDQRGTGGSYRYCDPRTLTVEQLLSDAHELIDYLKGLFRCDKVVLVCNGSGTVLGTLIAQRFPDLVQAYFGIGQVVSGVRREQESFAWTLNAARDLANKKDAMLLTRIGPPEQGMYHPIVEGLQMERRMLTKYSRRKFHTDTYMAYKTTPIATSIEYTTAEKVGVAHGYRSVIKHLWPELSQYDFLNEGHVFEMPYYLFQAREDRSSPSGQVQEYYEVLEAPDKDLVWFEKSNHDPLDEEPLAFKQVLREKLGHITATTI